MGAETSASRQNRILGRWEHLAFRWIAVGAAAVAFVVMNDAGGQLARSELGGQSFGASLFTGFHPRFWEVEGFGEALAVWRSMTVVDFRVLVFAHVVADIVFIVVYWMLLLWWMERLHVERARLKVLALIVLVSDLLETLSAGAVLLPSRATGTGVGPVAVQFFGLCKWIALGAVVFAAIHAYVTDDRGISLKRTREKASVARAGGGQQAWSRFGGLGVLVAIFVLLVALPAGGPMEQIPDVIRALVSPPTGTYWVLFWAVVLVGFAILAVASAGFVTAAGGGRSKPMSPNRWQMIVAAAVVSAVLWILGWIVEGDRRWVPWAPFLVVLGVTVLGCLVRRRQLQSDASKWAHAGLGERLRHIFNTCLADPWEVKQTERTKEAPPMQEDEGEALTAQPGPDAKAQEKREPTDEEPQEEEAQKNGPPQRNEPETTPVSQETSVGVIGGLAGVVSVAAALGLVRASFLPMLFETDAQTRWFWWFTGGALLAILGGQITQYLVEKAAASDRVKPQREALAVLVGMAALVLGVFIARDPSWTPWISATGVLAAALAFFATVVAILSWVGNRFIRWDAPVALGWGVRTPWLLILVVVWAVASFINTEGGYHDARLAALAEADSEDEDGIEDEDDTVGAIFDVWVDKAERCGTGSIRLFMVAAPGGGIRAAYWTTFALESMFGPNSSDPCHEQHGPFLISAVSGGSVGAATWLATTGTDVLPTVAISAMSDDDALAQALAGMLFRDLPQPLTGLTDTWPDRAELMERAWVDTTSALGSVDLNIPLTGLGDHRAEWRPLLLLNGSSVVDGCRVVLTNMSGASWNSEPNCLAAPEIGTVHQWPFAATIGVSSNLGEPTEETCPGEADDMSTTPAVTAALLSARFPYVTPSGAVYRCPDQSEEPIPTYIVDGGYFENSGLLTVMEVWHAIEPRVDDYNSTHIRQVEPWIVVVDNHYRSSVDPPAPKRVTEVLTPLSTAGASRVLSPEALEQMAAFEMSQGHFPCDSTEKPQCRSTFVRIAPTRAPGVPAPLGWVLSERSREELQAAMKLAFDEVVKHQPMLGTVDVAFATVLSELADTKQLTPTRSAHGFGR